MATFSYTLSGTLTVPDGSVIGRHGKEIELPDGKIVRLWEALELECDDDQTDIEWNDAADMGISHDGPLCQFVED